MKIDFKKHIDKIRSFRYINLVYIAVFLAVLLLFWNKIVSIFKPANDAKNQDAKVTSLNNQYSSGNRVSSDGHFLLGDGRISQYTISQARSHAEQLSALLKTYKGSKWYSVALSFFGFGNVEKIKVILNPNYPSTYRRYVIDAYRNVYTDNFRSLEVDVRSELTGFAGSSYWNNDLTKYFIL